MHNNDIGGGFLTESPAIIYNLKFASIHLVKVIAVLSA